MRNLILSVLLLAAVSAAGQETMAKKTDMAPVIFASFAESPEQLQSAFNLAESIREFAGQYKNAPIWIYIPQELSRDDAELADRLASLKLELKIVEIPEEAELFFLSGLVFTAAAAEAEAENISAILVIMGNDTIVLQEPGEFILPNGKSLGYCPVMHKNISPLYSQPLDDFWQRAYALMQIKDSAIFPIVTPADGDTIRPYFNGASLAVRPEKALLRKWAANYALLYNDAEIRKFAEQDIYKKIFTFQVALVGAVLNNINRDEMTELSKNINYPIFFKEMYGAKKDFHDITGVTTIRCEEFFSKPVPGWEKQLKGPTDKINWMKKHLEKQ